ncbi:lactoferrin/transferrin family TonB-dependent receptor [Ursidibacter arcticus]
MKRTNQFNLNLISITLFSTLLFNTAQAEENNVTKLNDVSVTGTKKKIHRKDNEVTGLGKLVKNIDSINKEQILSIRDLTRYDPSISVVEQGRGASAGYSIRGVDRNRVALVVDGLPQIQSYDILQTQGGSGAINEVEYENIRAIEISKGASSAEYGSGSLGGAVGFKTKESKDIIKPGQNWGLNTKSAYSSKNKQYTNSFAFATEYNGFDALVIYTHRKGKELQVHKDAGNRPHTIQRVSSYLNEYELSNTPDEKAKYGWFLIDSECPTLNCTPKPKVKLTRGSYPIRREVPPLSENEEKNYLATVHPTEQVSANEYTGNGRIKPNPMDYKTDSWLARIGYQFTPKHYIGGILEHTKQRYDIQDMSVPKYFVNEEWLKNTIPNPNEGIYEGLNFLDGASFRKDPSKPLAQGLRWSRAKFVDERHSKHRIGTLYRYTNLDKNGLIDNLSFSVDKQEITIDNFLHLKHCSEYPTVNKNCLPSLNKPWSYYSSEHSIYTEKHKIIKLELDKDFKLGITKHKLGLLTGVDKFKSLLERKDYFEQYSGFEWNLISGNGTFDKPYIYHRDDAKIITKQFCNWQRPSGLTDCNTRKITGHNYYLALRDHISLTKYLDLGVGIRYDYHKMSSDDKWTGKGTYKTVSWNTGLVVKPVDYMSLSYRISTGFRVPSFQEQFGVRVPGFEKGKDDDAQYVSKLTTEKAFNQEWGISFRGDFGTIETSYFKNAYKDMIALASTKGLNNGSVFSYGYHNAQEIHLKGINLLGKLDWNGIWNKAPEGIYTSLAYNRIKPKKVKNAPNFTHIQSPLLDSLQPSRYILSLGYDHPEDKWGIVGSMTYSKGKDNAELIGTVEHGARVYAEKSTKKRTKPWRVYDLVGYVNIKDFLTLRMGVYNLFNTRYTTWESVRQSSINSLNSQKSVGNYERYAAPGRNFTLSAEMKF